MTSFAITSSTTATRTRRDRKSLLRLIASPRILALRTGIVRASRYLGSLFAGAASAPASGADSRHLDAYNYIQLR